MEQKIIFREMLSEIKELADQKGNVLTKEEVDQFLSNMHLNDEQLMLVYHYLEGQKIRVTGLPEEEKQPAEADAEPEETPEGQKEQEISESGSSEKEGSAEGDSMPVSLELYLEEISHLERALPEEELIWFHQAAEGNQEAVQKLAQVYLPMVADLAGEFSAETCLPEDLIQEGNLGLMTALLETEHRESLAAYQAELMNAVSKYMQDVISRQNDLRDMGAEMVSRVNYLNEAIHNLEEDLEHKVSVGELSAYLEMPEAEIRDILKMAGDGIEVEKDDK